MEGKRVKYKELKEEERNNIEKQLEELAKKNLEKLNRLGGD